MKLDMYNNHEQYVTEQLQSRAIGKWLRAKGIKTADLDTHPRISDVILLLNIKDAVGHLMTSLEECTWAGYWSVVYKQNKALRKKALNKLEQIVQASIDRHQKISTRSQNIGHDNKAKGPCLPRVTNTKREQQECREVPWY